MTSSFQSTAFQSSARPVDTFVRPPSVQPKTDIEQLAEALKTLNPKIQSFLETRLEKTVEEADAVGVSWTNGSMSVVASRHSLDNVAGAPTDDRDATELNLTFAF